ncbi:MAG: type IV toxin-antitoxin system AbiEi family antitoxin domain-containing protein [Actinobacteria bacterium]|nr:type IV toxin-antitoxin system AbiEi family antitoxin domain-containing protein [Actinomycetota bacterium]
MPRPELLATATLLRATFGTATFTMAAAEAAGVPRHRLHSATRAGLVVRLRQGIYRLPPEHDSGSIGCHGAGGGEDMKRPASTSAEGRHPALSTADELRLRDRLQGFDRDGIPASIGERTAARLGNVDLWGIPTERYPIIVVPRGSARRGSCGGITIIERDVEPRHTTTTDGPDPLPVVDPLHAALQVAAMPQIDMAARVAVVNSGMRRQLAHSEQLTGPEAEARLSGYFSEPRVCRALLLQARHRAATIDVQHRRTLLEAVSRTDPRVETVLESISWNAFIDAELDLPTPQVTIVGASGRRWRVDFLFGDRVIGECDGAVKYGDAASLWREKKRQEDLEQAGYIVVRWTWEEVMHRPWEVVERIRRALARAAALSGVR